MMSGFPKNLRKLPIHRKLPDEEIRWKKLVLYVMSVTRLFCQYHKNLLIEIWFQLTLFASRLVNLKVTTRKSYFPSDAAKLREHTLALFHFYPFLAKLAIIVNIPFVCWTLHLATPGDFNYTLNLILLFLPQC